MPLKGMGATEPSSYPFSFRRPELRKAKRLSVAIWRHQLCGSTFAQQRCESLRQGRLAQRDEPDCCLRPILHRACSQRLLRSRLPHACCYCASKTNMGD